MLKCLPPFCFILCWVLFYFNKGIMLNNLLHEEQLTTMFQWLGLFVPFMGLFGFLFMLKTNCNHPLFFFFYLWCPGQLTRTKTNLRIHWTPCKSSKQVRHIKDNRHARWGSNKNKEIFPLSRGHKPRCLQSPFLFLFYSSPIRKSCLQLLIRKETEGQNTVPKPISKIQYSRFLSEKNHYSYRQECCMHVVHQVQCQLSLDKLTFYTWFCFRVQTKPIRFGVDGFISLKTTRTEPEFLLIQFF